MGYPIVLANPLRASAQFTEQYGGTQGVYLTPTGETIGFDDLRRYTLSGFSSLPSATDIRTAQRALGIAETGELDADTMAAVVNVQLQFGLVPTGVPKGDTLEKIVSAGGSLPKKKKKGGGGGEVALLLVLVLLGKSLFGGD